jgi:RNA polymerase sigma-70 factor (ECF subfamily)
VVIVVSPPDSAIGDAHLELDRQLIGDVAAGSAEALGRLYDRHAAAAYGLARRIVQQPEAAEEVVQDVFAQIWREAGRYQRDRASVAGWILMVARTRAIDHLRARRARPDVAQAVGPSALPTLTSGQRDPERLTMSAEESGRVRSALQELPAVQRDLVELAYFEGMTHTEIAERTGVPLGTVKTRLRTAMHTLRGRLDGMVDRL